jgi:leader peptidase (prepilin peptidase)/N-methyltransferase
MPQTLIVSILAAIVGLLVGSFLATMVLRLPRRQPVVMDRSACPLCGHRLGASELIPLASWFIQRRRCRACGGRISAFYPLMEILSAAVALASFQLQTWPTAIAACLGGWFLLTLSASATRKWLRHRDARDDRARGG